MDSAPLYLDFGRPPFWNMAFDEVLFERALFENVPLQLRLYTWQPGAITFGFNQSTERAVTSSELGETKLIRRVTGGRAIYHDQSELTYSIAVNTDFAPTALAQSLSHSSARIAELLAAFVEAAGKSATIAHKSVGMGVQSVKVQSAPCFESVARHELLSGEKKIAASAQRRIGSAYLQHGSIKLEGVASHPAIPLRESSDDQDGSLNPLSSMRFDSLAELFSEVVGKTLSIRIEVNRPDSALCDAVEKRCEFVEKNALLKRDFFEHQITAKSL